MKHLLNKAAIVLTLACIPAMLHAQTPSVLYGRTTIQLSTGFTNSIQGLGAVITDLDSNPIQNSSMTFQATGGTIDLQTSAGEVEHAGGWLVDAAGTIIRIQNFTIDNSNPGAPIVTAAFIFNNHYVERLPLFDIQPPPGFGLPLQTQAGVLQENGLILTLDPATAAALNGLFGGPVIQGGTNIGTANVYLVFGPGN